MSTFWQKLLAFSFPRKNFGYRLEDNLDEFVRDHLNDMIADAEFLDIATGYFHVSGYQLVADNIESLAERNRPVRVLLGNLHRDELSRSTARLLLRLIENPKIQVRTIKPRRLHAKLFITGDRWTRRILFGSSNLTRGGLIENVELNTFDIVGRRNPRALSLLNWFSEMWGTSLEIDKALLEEILQAAREERGKFHLLFMAAALKDLRHLDLRDIVNFAQAANILDAGIATISPTAARRNTIAGWTPW